MNKAEKILIKERLDQLEDAFEEDVKSFTQKVVNSAPKTPFAFGYIQTNQHLSEFRDTIKSL
jgi:hypothetical protein